MVLIEQLCMQLFLWLLALIAGLMNIFAAISGVDDVIFNGSNVNILQTFLIGKSTVETVFSCFLLRYIVLVVSYAILACYRTWRDLRHYCHHQKHDRKQQKYHIHPR